MVSLDGRSWTGTGVRRLQGGQGSRSPCRRFQSVDSSPSIPGPRIQGLASRASHPGPRIQGLASRACIEGFSPLQSGSRAVRSNRGLPWGPRSRRGWSAQVGVTTRSEEARLCQARRAFPDPRPQRARQSRASPRILHRLVWTIMGHCGYVRPSFRRVRFEERGLRASLI